MVAFCAGAALAGPVPGAGRGAAGPWLVARVLRARRERYRRAVDAGCAQMAVALADAVGGGHSLRAALGEAAPGAGGAAGHELRRTSRGARRRGGHGRGAPLAARQGRSERVDVLVAACVLQRRAGGDLARLLRDSATAMEEQGRLEGELRAATAQARFTGALVVLLPAGGALLAELASPGWLAGLARVVPDGLAGRARARAPGARGGAHPPPGTTAPVIAAALAFLAAALGMAGAGLLLAPRATAPRRARSCGGSPPPGMRLRDVPAPRDLDARLDAAGRPGGLGSSAR